MNMVHDTKGRVIAVDETDSHVVASVCFDHDDGHIVAVMTEKAMRKKGIASMLMASAVANCKAAGLESVWLEVQDRSPHLIPLYGKLGFKVTPLSLWVLGGWGSLPVTVRERERERWYLY